MIDNSDLVVSLGQLLIENKWQITTAESCTGGGIASALTSVSGSSLWFEQGFVTYSNTAKQYQLGVEKLLLDQYGAVSEPVVRAMAEGACQRAKADISIAVSGIAGPGGGSIDKPVGTVWLAWVLPNMGTVAKCYCFNGNRDSVRSQAVTIAISELAKQLAKNTV